MKKTTILTIMLMCIMTGVMAWALIVIINHTKPVPKLQRLIPQKQLVVYNCIQYGQPQQIFYNCISVGNPDMSLKALDCNKQTVLWWLKTLGVKHYKIAYAQSILESGTYTSKICKENNNLFGMRLAKKRKTTALGQRNGFAYYQDYIHSIMDYKLYQDYCFGSKLNEMSTTEYMYALKKAGYWEDSTYISKIQSVIKREFNSKLK